MSAAVSAGHEKIGPAVVVGFVTAAWGDNASTWDGPGVAGTALAGADVTGTEVAGTTVAGTEVVGTSVAGT
jgi:hypothetical protein